MGGPLSGRGRFAPKSDAFWRLDIAKLKELGFLRDGPERTLIWSANGEERASIGVTWLGNELRLSYRVRSGHHAWEAIEDMIPLAFTYPHFGGVRDWFVCPSCRRRKRVLWGRVYYRCRECHGAVYESQYEPDYWRALHKAQSIRHRLGGSMSVVDPFPPKPKWMRWRTYEKLRAEDKRLELVWALGDARALRNW